MLANYTAWVGVVSFITGLAVIRREQNDWSPVGRRTLVFSRRRGRFVDLRKRGERRRPTSGLSPAVASAAELRSRTLFDATSAACAATGLWFIRAATAV
jgi:hypothetical protein